MRLLTITKTLKTTMGEISLVDDVAGEREEEGEEQEVQHRGEDHGLQHRDGQEEG